MVVALTTGHKIGLAAFAAVFIGFAVSSALLVPRFRPQFPGRALPFFLLATVGLFAAMLTAVIVFGREGKEAEAGHEATTGAKPAGPARKVVVDESEFKIALQGGATSLKPGAYEFDAKNTGKIGHDLVIDGPGVSNEKTPVFDAGKTATLKVTLKAGTYELYCSVPGHKQAGMDLRVKVA